MASHLNYIGDLQKGCLTVLMIPGGMATSPAVYEGAKRWPASRR